MKTKCPYCGLVDSHTRICNGAIIPDPKKVRERRERRKEYEKNLLNRRTLAKYNPQTKQWDLPNCSESLKNKFDLTKGLKKLSKRT